MSPRVLEAIERVLMAALAVILALGVWNGFVRLLQEPEGEITVATTTPPAPTAAPSTTTRAPIVARTTTTTLGTDTTLAATAFPFGDGTCRQTQPRTSESVTLLRVYFNCGNVLEPSGTTFVYRTVPRTLQRLTYTLQELVQGPTEDEQALGFGSFFSADTADAFRSVTINDGRAYIDFNRIDLPEIVKTEQGRRFFVLNIAANALQFDSVTSVEISLEGSCEAFSELVGTTGCTVITQADF